MSQQKFASNVVEKCLAFGGPAERQILVNEMLGSTDENEPLQACQFCKIYISRCGWKAYPRMDHRKNKTLQALQLSQNGSSEETEMAVDITALADTNEDPSMEIEDGRDDEEMEVEDGDAGGDRSDFQEKILGVLKQGDFEEKRSSKHTQVD